MRWEWLGVWLLASCSLQDRLVHCGDMLCPFGSTCGPTGGCALPVDARFFDAQIDAPFACPPIGTTPQFSTLWHQDSQVQNCHDYNFSSTGLAVAVCEGGIDDGVVDQAMTQTNVDPAAIDPRITVEGDSLFVVASSRTAIEHYNHVSGWTIQNNITMSLNMLGAPSAQPDRRVFYVDGNFAHEVALSDTTLTPIMSYAAAELGVQTLGSAPNLSPDNLRIVFAGVLVGQTTAQVYYADRATATGRFGVARLIGHAPLGVTDPFMTGDCGRLYFSTAGAVFYAQQD